MRLNLSPVIMKRITRSKGPDLTTISGLVVKLDKAAWELLALHQGEPCLESLLPEGVTFAR